MSLIRTLRIIILIALLQLGSLVFAKSDSIVIGFNPGGNPEVEKKLAVELASDLQNELGISVNVFMGKDYQSLVEAMKSGKIDFGFFSVYSFVEAEKSAGAKVLLKKIWKSPQYYSVILVPQKSKISRLKELKGKKIAFVDEISASGFLYPMVALLKAGIPEADLRTNAVYSGNHAASISMFEQGKVDAVAVFADDSKGRSGAWEKFHSGKDMKVKVIWTSEPIPNDPFCVRENFYTQNPMLTHSVMLGLIDIFEKNKDKYKLLLGSEALMPATSRQYDPVREMIQFLKEQKK